MVSEEKSDPWQRNSLTKKTFRTILMSITGLHPTTLLFCVCSLSPSLYMRGGAESLLRMPFPIGEFFPTDLFKFLLWLTGPSASFLQRRRLPVVDSLFFYCPAVAVYVVPWLTFIYRHTYPHILIRIPTANPQPHKHTQTHTHSHTHTYIKLSLYIASRWFKNLLPSTTDWLSKWIDAYKKQIYPIQKRKTPKKGTVPDNYRRTNYVKARIDKTLQNSRCRLCGDRDETIDDIKSECRKLTQKDYLSRIDWVTKMIH